ncbi:flagellar basal body rod protein FlgB [Caldovatus aquaticus]|uniref:Flagellar basal body protein n=1 Tax=Caldovatus aquaticus TaxID=2865671 RepID=A0ABS7F2K7_9PROT|nr:flagellar basal body protein [Caldovatus aquaticus]MBW8269832.1 flagellar basal body protein [Caldovatus aquaticus]
MDPTRSGPIALAEYRLRWLDRRQEVLAQNIANADTPGYRPRDLRPFAEILARSGAAPAAFAVTQPGHLRPAREGAGAWRAVEDRNAAERAPNGNAVALDEQALRVADTDAAHALAMGLHRRYLAMFRAALGRPG